MSASPQRRFNAVTTFNDEGYERYGRRFLASFDRRWPAEVTLHVFYEETLPSETSGRFVYHNLLAEIPELVSFKERHRENTIRTGHHKDGEYGYRTDAVRFAHKVFALTQCGLSLMDQADVLFWLDADTVTFEDIPAELLEALLPVDAYTSYLGRAHTHSECGFVGYNLAHESNNEFMSFWRKLYLDDSLFQLPEWHDSFVYDVIRKTFEDKGKFTSFNIAAANPASDHPFVNSVLGNYMDHLKGKERKVAGKSFEDDFVVKRLIDNWAHDD